MILNYFYCHEFYLQSYKLFIFCNNFEFKIRRWPPPPPRPPPSAINNIMIAQKQQRMKTIKLKLRI